MESPTLPGNEQYLLELAARPSDALNGALQEFIRPVNDFEPVQLRVGRKAMRLINLRSFQTAVINEPRQIDRGIYGEGDGVALGKYNKNLELYSRHTVAVGEDDDLSGYQINGRGDARVWLTLRPNPSERQTIVAPPIFEHDQQNPDLRMYFLVNHLYFVGKPAAAVALNSLHVRLAQERDEQCRLQAERTRAIAEAARTNQPDMSAAFYKPRTFYVSQIHARRSDRQIQPPAQEPNESTKPSGKAA